MAVGGIEVGVQSRRFLGKEANVIHSLQDDSIFDGKPTPMYERGKERKQTYYECGQVSYDQITNL